MTYQYSPVSHGLPSLPQYLPPGCKFLSCHDAQNVLRSCSTWRLPNGTLVAPLGGELYQVVEVPANCDERCSLHQVCSVFPDVSRVFGFKGVVRNHLGYMWQATVLEYRGKTEDISFSKPCSFTMFLSLMLSLI